MVLALNDANILYSCINLINYARCSYFSNLDYLVVKSMISATLLFLDAIYLTISVYNHYERIFSGVVGYRSDGLQYHFIVALLYLLDNMEVPAFLALKFLIINSYLLFITGKNTLVLGIYKITSMH